MRKTLIIVVAVIVAIAMFVLAGVAGRFLGYSAGKDKGFSDGYDIGYDACLAKLTGDVWLVETAEKVIEIADEYLDGAVDASEASLQIEAAAIRYIEDDTKLQTGCGELLRNGIRAIYMGIDLTTYGVASEEEVAEYDAQTLKTRNTIAKHLGIAER